MSDNDQTVIVIDDSQPVALSDLYPVDESLNEIGFEIAFVAAIATIILSFSVDGNIFHQIIQTCILILVVITVFRRIIVSSHFTNHLEKVLNITTTALFIISTLAAVYIIFQIVDIINRQMNSLPIGIILIFLMIGGDLLMRKIYNEITNDYLIYRAALTYNLAVDSNNIPFKRFMHTLGRRYDRQISQSDQELPEKMRMVLQSHRSQGYTSIQIFLHHITWKQVVAGSAILITTGIPYLFPVILNYILFDNILITVAITYGFYRIGAVFQFWYARYGGLPISLLGRSSSDLSVFFKEYLLKHGIMTSLIIFLHLLLINW